MRIFAATTMTYVIWGCSFLFAQPQENAVASQTKAIVIDDSLKAQTSDQWFSADKYSHLAVSAFLVAGQMFILRDQTDFSENRSLAIAVSSTALIGIAKEIHDGVSKKGTASWKDLVADFVGIGIGVGVLVFKVN